MHTKIDISILPAPDVDDDGLADALPVEVPDPDPVADAVELTELGPVGIISLLFVLETFA